MKLRSSLALFLGLGAALFAAGAQAKTFRTQFIKIDLPANWSCTQEELDWVCQPDDLSKRSEAIIAIVTKAMNAVDDNMPKYQSILSTPRDMRDLLGNSYKSEVRFVRPHRIRDQDWMDGLSFGSEIPGFYTRYLASVKDKVAGLVSFSIGESVYTKWAPELDQMVESLEIHFDEAAFNELMSKSGSLFSPKLGKGGRFAPKVDDAKQKAPETGTDYATIFGVIVLIGAVGYYVYAKKKKGGGA